MPKNPLISIIIPTRNEAANLLRCLTSIKQQDCFKKKAKKMLGCRSYKIEVIVVDNHSIDETIKIARNFGKKNQQKEELRQSLRLRVFTHGPERSAQRNFGMLKKARGKYLLYLDADMSLSPALISRAVTKMQRRSKLAGLYLREQIVGQSLWARVRNFERQFYTGTVIDAVRFIKTDAFKKAGGFDENLTGPEDWDLDKRLRELGTVAVLDGEKNVEGRFVAWDKKTAACIYHHEENLNLRQFLKKKAYYAQDFPRYRRKWQQKNVQSDKNLSISDPDVHKQFSITYRYAGVFLENGKWRLILQQPGLFILAYCCKIALGIYYLWLKSKSSFSALSSAPTSEE